MSYLCFLYVVLYHLTGSMWDKGLQVGGLFWALGFIIFCRLQKTAQKQLLALGCIGLPMLLLWFDSIQTSILLLVATIIAIIPDRLFQSPSLKRYAFFLHHAVTVFSIILLCTIIMSFRDSLLTEGNSEWLKDIGWNTQIATHHFLDGANPYANNAQLWKDIQASRHVSITDDGVSMYGLSYRYGFPYFPMMLYGYAPFVWLIEGLHSIRVANGCLYLLVLYFLHQISSVSFKRQHCFFVLLSWLNIPFMVEQLFIDGINDILPAVLMLFGFHRYLQGSRFFCGVLFGFAQGAKLFPGVLGFLPIFLFTFQRNRTAAREMLLGFIAGASCVILPFLLYDPEHFVSSTILFYIVQHGMGDSSSIYFYLPSMFKPFWNIGGMLFSIGISAFLAMRAQNIPSVMAITSLGYILFIGVNRMSHVNYLIAVLPLAMIIFSPHFTFFTAAFDHKKTTSTA